MKDNNMDINNITIADISNLQFNDWKLGKIISEENIEEINRFPNKTKLFYHCNPIYNSAYKINNFKYIIIKDNGDEILIRYKIVQIMTTKQIRIFHSPVSLSNNNDNIDLIINNLKKINYVKFIYKNTEYINKLFSEKEELIPYYDFYLNYNLKDKYDNKYLKRHRINFVYNNPDFTFLITSEPDVNLIMTIREQWKNKFNFSISDKKYLNCLKYRNGNVKYLILYYKNVPFAVTIFFIDNDNKYIDVWSDIYYSKDYMLNYFIEEKDQLAISHIYNRGLSLILQYITYKETNINMLYIAGCHESEKKIYFPYKLRVSDGYEKYYIS